MNKKIAIIGAGSAYMASVFNGIIHSKNAFDGSEIALMDVDDEHLQLMYNLGCTMFSVTGCQAKLKMTTKRVEAISDADFVLTTFRPGGFEARHLDESIPLKYGIIGNETIGPGGIFMACRSIPIVIDIAKDVEKYCPKAIILNYTNPTNLVTAALTRYTNARVIGLCDQHVGELNALAELLGVNSKRLFSNSRGLNHATWMTDLNLDGQNVLHQVTNSAQQKTSPIDPNLKISLDLLEIYGAFPTYYLRYYYFADTILKYQKQSNKTRAQEIMEDLPAIWASYEDAIKGKQSKPNRQRGGGDHGEFALELILALSDNVPQIKILNLVNGSALPDFPVNSIVEGPAVVSAQGSFLIAQEPLPSSIIGLLQSLVSCQDLVVDAAVKGDKRLLLKALVANPLVQDIEIAQNLLDDMLNAHKSNLPQFFSI
jgi:6-phospho-beta-glucosidase